MAQYLPILAMIVLVVLFASLSFTASKLLGPRRPTSAKRAPYECGIVPDREPTERFPVRFYLVAMIFIIFDIEIIFLYPYAIVFHELGAFGLWELVLFSVAVDPAGGTSTRSAAARASVVFGSSSARLCHPAGKPATAGLSTPVTSPRTTCSTRHTGARPFGPMP